MYSFYSLSFYYVVGLARHRSHTLAIAVTACGMVGWRSCGGREGDPELIPHAVLVVIFATAGCFSVNAYDERIYFAILIAAFSFGLLVFAGRGNSISLD